LKNNIDDIKARIDIVDVARNYTTLKRQGNRYIGCCPLHQEKTPSFDVNHEKQLFHCFGCGVGGDVITLVEKCENLTTSEAIKKLQAASPESKPKVTRKSSQTKGDGRSFVDRYGMGWVLVVPVPSDAPPRWETVKVGDGENRRYREPSMVYEYKNISGALEGYKYRFEKGDGLPKKLFIPLTCWRDQNGKLSWWAKDIPDNRSLYGLLDLAKNPNAPVLMVSGEKCVDAARPKLENYVVVTWSGGDNGKHTDFSPLKGRQIVWWPDNDITSKNSMIKLADKLGGQILEIPQDKGYEKGWDCADAVQSGLDLTELISIFLPPLKAAAVKYADLSIIAPLHIYPHVGPKEKIIGTVENLRAILSHYGLNIWYNEISCEKECAIRGVPYIAKDSINSFYAKVTSICNLNGYPYKFVDKFLDHEAMETVVNPVKNWIDFKAWDGERRVAKILDAIVCNSDFNNEFKETLVIKWLLSAVAAAYRQDGDRYRTRGVLMFQGDQHIGKTNFLKDLCGAAWGGNTDWFGEGLSLDGGSKDDIISVNSYWIAELAEFERMTAKGNPTLKAITTTSKHKLRKAYARDQIKIYRRTVYAGTVNPKGFLTDLTGNSRYWVIPVVKFKDISEIDMQQVWAEVKRFYDVQIEAKEKYIWWLSPEEEALLSKSNEAYEAPSTAADLLDDTLDWDAPDSKWRKASCTELLTECGVPPGQGKSLVTAAGQYLHRRGLNNDSKGRKYWAPPKKVVYVGWGNDDDQKWYQK